MRILVIGAGVLGSLYAARLHDAGHDVTILARGDRLAAVRRSGFVVRDEATGLVSTSLVPAIDALDPGDRHDAALVFVRRDQRSGVVPILAANGTPTILFMGNDASGAGGLVAALGEGRVMLGFPGAGGAIVDDVVHARLAPGRTLPTTIGELDGSESARARELAVVLRSAGFPTAISPRIDAWLRTHAAVVVPVAAAIYAAGGDVHRVARTPDLRILIVRAVRDGLAVLRSSGVPVTPSAYALLSRLPEGVLTRYVSRAFDTEQAELMLARHALKARTEMAALEGDLRALAGSAGVATPWLDRLAAWMDPAIEPLEDRSRTLVVHHPMRAAGIGAASALLGFGVLFIIRRARPDAVARSPLAGLATRMPSLRGTTVATSPLTRIAAWRPSRSPVDVPRPSPVRGAGIVSRAIALAILVAPRAYAIRKARTRLRKPGFWPYMRTPAA